MKLSATARMFARLILLGGALCIALPVSAQQAPPVGDPVLAQPVYCPTTGRTIPAGTDAYELDRLCPPRSSSGSSPSESQLSPEDQAAADALGQGAYQLGEALGNWLVRSLFGSPKPNNTPSSDAAAAAAERAHEMAIEREREAEIERERELEAAREAKFRLDMKQLELVMGGPKLPDETKLFHDNSTCFFNIGCNSGNVLQFQQIDLAPAQRTFSDPLDQLRISTCLSKMAAAAKTPDEAKYLSGEAAKAMNGSPVDVDVSGCAPAAQAGSPITPVGAQQTGGAGITVGQPDKAPPPTPVASLTPQQVTLFRSLLASTNKEMDELANLQEQKVKLETQKAELMHQIQSKQQLFLQEGGRSNGAGMTPERMAEICNRRTALTQQQARLADEVASEELAMRDLYADFQKNAAAADWWSEFGSKAKKYDDGINGALEKLDPLGKLAKGAGKIPTSEGTLEMPELEDYLIIARGMVAWTADFAKLTMSHAVSGLDKDTTAKLQELQTLESHFTKGLGALRQVNQGLVPLPACDTTQLVKAESTAPQQSDLGNTAAALQAVRQQLSDAQKSEAQIDNQIKQVDHEMQQVGYKLKQNQSCFQQAQADPSKAASLSATCAQ